MEELAAFLTYEMHLRLAPARARIAVLQFLVLLGPHNLHNTSLFEPRKVAVDGAERNRGQALRELRRLENSIRIFNHAIENLLSCLGLVFHFFLSDF